MRFLIAVDVTAGCDTTIPEDLGIVVTVPDSYTATIASITKPADVDLIEYIMIKETLTLTDRDIITRSIGGGTHFNTN